MSATAYVRDRSARCTLEIQPSFSFSYALKSTVPWPIGLSGSPYSSM
jgi:hypothetical protein